MKKCKICKISKEHVYFTRDEQMRSVHKDEQGGIWHGNVCYSCQKEYVRKTSGKVPLTTITCEQCQKVVKQRTKVQRTCSKECYKKLMQARP